MRKLFLLAGLALLPLAAQTKSYVLKAVRIFDGTRITSPGLVVVTGSKIFSVGPGSMNRKSTLAGLSMTMRDRKSLTGPIATVRSNERKTMLIGR